MFEQSERFRDALMQTRGITLVHTIGEPNSYKTILTPTEFCGILTDLRDRYDLRDKTKELEEKSIRRKKRVFVDMDNVLVDFQSGLDLQSDEIKKEYEGRLDEIPGLFAEMKPMPGAIEAMHTLQEHFDLYICRCQEAQTHISVDQRYGVRPRGNYRHIPPAMGNRATIQTDETELSPQILLWRKRQCHQDPNLGNAYHKPAAYGDAERVKTSMELLWTCYYGQNYAHVLR